MADNINNRPPAPYWPWGGRRTIREKLVSVEQLERKQRLRKGDAKNPPLASAALLEFIGPGHTSEELRLPEPPVPVELEAQLGGEVGSRCSRASRTGPSRVSRRAWSAGWPR